MLGPVERLPQPILSRLQRRIVFIPTTWQKFINAVEINDLYDESSLEDRLWAELKRLQMSAERQEFVAVNGRSYALDFALYCARGRLNLETDGDTWHADPKRIPLDNLRDNDLETDGWKLLRFNTLQIREQLTDYCIPTILENVHSLGGVEDGSFVPAATAWMHRREPFSTVCSMSQGYRGWDLGTAGPSSPAICLLPSAFSALVRLR